MVFEQFLEVSIVDILGFTVVYTVTDWKCVTVNNTRCGSMTLFAFIESWDLACNQRNKLSYNRVLDLAQNKHTLYLSRELKTQICRTTRGHEFGGVFHTRGKKASYIK